MSKIDIQDNFLDSQYCENLKNLFLSNRIGWTYGEVVTDDVYTSDSNLDNVQFGHMIYDNDSPVSPFYDEFIDFVNKIPVATTCKIKVNMNPRTHKIIEHGLHTDLPYRCKTGILYLNTNDGYTIFEDGTKIESVENRFVSFDSNIKHSGTSCTNQQVRLVVNINYFAPDLHINN